MRKMEKETKWVYWIVPTFQGVRLDCRILLGEVEMRRTKPSAHFFMSGPCTAGLASPILPTTTSEL